MINSVRGTVSLKETGARVPGLLVHIFDVDSCEVPPDEVLSLDGDGLPRSRVAGPAGGPIGVGNHRRRRLLRPLVRGRASSRCVTSASSARTSH